MIRHRACTLRDTAYALIKAEMDTDFEEQCQEISKTRKARQERLNPPPVRPVDAATATTPLHEACHHFLENVFFFLEIII